ncbi:MAG: DJ-1/PfpI family protein [Treponema sp.]|nr:DJ-1/PfpI family protein [Candidatus Treponema equi]
MKALVFLANGFEEIEAITPIDYLRRAGIDVTTVATGTSSRTVEGSHGIPVIADMTLETYVSSCAELPDAVVVPGGMPGSTNIGNCAQALAIINSMYDEKKLVCAICAAPAVVLSKTKVLDGRKWTCYPGMEGEAGEKASSHVADVPFVSEGTLVTGRGPGCAEQFAMEIVRVLCGEETQKKIKTGSVQR